MSTPPATYPDAIWDGDTENPDREARRWEANPNNQDWDRSVSEIIAMQTQSINTHNYWRVPQLVSWTWEKNQKTGINSLGGGLTSLATANTINTGNDIVVAKNLSKLLIVVNSYTTPGTITITGNRVSSLTGNVTANYTEEIIINDVTNDATANTANNDTTKWSMDHAYVTNEMYAGTVTISTTDLVSTDIDTYSAWWFQNPTLAAFKLDAVTFTGAPTNNAAAADVIVYSAISDRDAKTVNIQPITHIEIDSQYPIVDPDGLLAIQRVGFPGLIDPSTYDGVFVNVSFYPALQSYWEHVMVNIWSSWWYSQIIPTVQP
jgi:hypothetical protein